jgi:homoaconitase/3-isopropylmalate dehydratase large subunit
MVKAHLKFFWIIILLHISVHGLFSQEIPVKDLILSSYIQIGPEFRNYRSFAYYDDVLFVHDAELNLWSIPDPVIDQDENRARLLNERQTREYVNERWGASGEVQVDGEGRLFIDGQLVTRDFPTWLAVYGRSTRTGFLEPR